MKLLVIDQDDIEGVQGVRNGFSIDDEVHGAPGGVFNQGLWQRHSQPETVDAGDGLAAFADQQAASVVLLLHPVVGVNE